MNNPFKLVDKLNEKGASFPLALVVLVIVLFFVSYFILSFLSSIQFYEMLESYYFSATINEMEE
ncbi:hypothetical protein [Paenisporosarcina cavernae]|uniref:Uncharacterized protein n=1 Tax=Paenisporosarcina cavernae TaxID=2320858 RepID=A0A385YTC0_9BACL|nr:hypothetical protein [Paenisporosarcina cavernae]AYC29560.1 hypothetical protein D3873_06565 [Paenisporosarcina cavernae]